MAKVNYPFAGNSGCLKQQYQENIWVQKGRDLPDPPK
jgi:hypothetical protein